MPDCGLLPENCYKNWPGEINGGFEGGKTSEPQSPQPLRGDFFELSPIPGAVDLFPSPPRATTTSSRSSLCPADGIAPTVASCYHIILHLRGADRNSNLVGVAIQTAREVYLLVTEQDEIRIQVFPIYKGKYINLEKVKDNVGLMRRMLGLNRNG